MNLDYFYENNIVSSKHLTYLKEFEIKALSVELPFCLSNLFQEYGGDIIDRGLFRIHNWGSSYYWSQVCSKFFNISPHSIYCFGFDWMGRNFALDLTNINKIFLLDYTTGEVLEMEQTLEGFFNEDLVDYKNDTLAVEFFNLVSENIKEELNFENCLTYKIPLFLGGTNTIENFEIMNMEVCWEINYQIYAKIKNLPENTLINNVTFD